MIKLSDSAVDVLSRYIESSSLPVCAVRITVAKSEQSEPRFNLKFERDIIDNDAIADFGSFKVLVDRYDVPFVRGLEIDFVNRSESAGFKFHVPNSVPNAA